jgi:hypothetical protein
MEKTHMSNLVKIAYIIDFSFAFACGFLAATFFPANATRLEALSSIYPIAYVVIGACVIASGLTAYVMAYALRRQPRWMLFLVRLFYFGLPAVAGGIMLSAVFGWLGLVKLTHPTFYLGLISMSDVSGGVAGIVAMASIPEYHQIFSTGPSK